MTKVRIGFSTAICGVLVVVEMMAAEGVNVHHRGGAAICLALGLVGFLIWATSGFGQAKPADPVAGQDAPAGEPAPEDPLALFRSRSYWGRLLVFAAVVLAVTSAYRYREPKPSPIAPKPKPALPVPPPPPPPAITFPPLKLQGLVVHGTQSSAIINGQVLLVGEGIGDVRLVAVDAEHATVELDGQTNVLSLSK